MERESADALGIQELVDIDIDPVELAQALLSGSQSQGGSFLPNALV